MVKAIFAAVAFIAVATLIVGCQQKTGIAGVADAMGATSLNSIEYSGGGELSASGRHTFPASAGRVSYSGAITSRSITRRPPCE